MPSLDQCLGAPLETTEMATYSTNMELFSNFKTIDEEKDSDEESFHLFIEGDDEIINKTEDKRLSSEGLSNHQKMSSDEKSLDEAANMSEETFEAQLSKSDSDILTTEQNDSLGITQSNEISKKCSVTDANVEAIIDSDTQKQTDDESEGSDRNENVQNNSNIISEKINGNLEEKRKSVDQLTDNQEPTPTENSTDQMETEDDILNKFDNTNVQVAEVDDPITEDILLDDGDDFLEKIDMSKSNKADEISSSIEEKTDDEVKDHQEHMDVEEVTQTIIESKTNDMSKKKTDCNVNEIVEKHKTDASSELQSTKNDSSSPLNESKLQENSEGLVPTNSENSNDSSPTSDNEDLLDITMIKDSAQDDADIAEDELLLAKENEEDNDKEDSGDDDTTFSKQDETSEVDDTINSEHIDIDDSTIIEQEKENSNVNVDEQKTSEVRCDGEDSVVPGESDSKDSGFSSKDSCADGESKDENIPSESDLVSEIPKNTVIVSEKQLADIVEQNDVSVKTVDNTPIDDPEVARNKSTKRTLSDSESENQSKKIKLQDDKKQASIIEEMQSLLSFSKFMTNTHLKQLTRTDLEEFCVQKICEVILHKSELGETNHQLKVQEQTIESMRKEQQILSKQIKDLEIVNKKLMHEVKNYAGVKPLIPVKITRSVGLQVRMNQNVPTDNIHPVKRRTANISPQKAPTVVNRSPKVITQIGLSTPARQMVNSPKKIAPTTPILNQALQNRNRTIVKVNPNRTTTPSFKPKAGEKPKPPGSSFIDLTDEDDKRANSKVTNTAKTVTTIPQGIRLSTTSVKTPITSVIPVVTSTTPQLMYVVQSNSQLSQGVLTTSSGAQKTVLLNFQPTNGVLGSPLNGSSVSVIPKTTNTVQLKTTSSVLKPTKHPAALPNPPVIQVLGEKLMKAIPPKPHLTIRKTNTGIILQWRMPYELSKYETIASYQLYAYQETAAAPSTDMWRKVGDVKAMALPMACTLTQFADKNKYYFAVRPVDIHKRIGRFSNPEEISL